MDKNKGNRQTGKKKKMIEGHREKNQIQWKKEMKARANRYKELSMKVNPNWPLLDEIQSLTLNNLPKFIPGAHEVLFRAGKIGEYRLELDSLQKKNAVKFTSFNEIDDNRFSTHEISMDENMMNYIDESNIKGLKIITTDLVLATLMNFSKSVYSWDIKVEKIEDMIFLSKRELGEKEEFNAIDMENVGENSSKPPPATVDDPKSRKLFVCYLALTFPHYSTCTQYCSPINERRNQGKLRLFLDSLINLNINLA